MKYVIVTNISPSTNPLGKRRAGPAAQSQPVTPKVEVDELKPQRAAILSRQKNILGVAPVMPMRLIEPVDTNVQPVQTPAGVTWGVQAVGADTSPFTGEGIVVSVLDTGIDITHPAFTGVDVIRKNFTSDTEDDVHGHGTHCAGTIFGRNVRGIRIGVAPGINKVLIGKVLGKGGGGSDQIASAIQWAVTEGANVISMSLGIDFPGYVEELVEIHKFPQELATSMALEGYRTNVLLFERLASFIVAQNAFGRSALIIAAAGNESRRDVNPEFEIAVSPPAVADGIVSVAALAQTTQGLTVAPFSNVGARVSGPGVGINSAKPGGDLTLMNGTSMATPHVAGVAALWAQKLKESGQFNAKLLAERLIGTAGTEGFVAGFEPSDIGAGLVRAPK